MNYYVQIFLLCLVLVEANGKPTTSIICNAKLEQSDPEARDFDCSNLNLDWHLLNHLIDSTRAATNLNLAYNKFNSTVSNNSFNLFKLLRNTLNLSSNSLQTIESHAFYYEVQLIKSTNDTSALEPLQIMSLDLSNNSISQLPWNSIKLLANLKHLYLSHNDISSLDMGDLHGESKYNDGLFASLTHIYLNSCEMKHVKPEILNFFKNLALLDLSSNLLKHLDANIGQVLAYNNDQQIKAYTRLDLKNNLLQCNCKLLWLKKYLLKYGNDPGQECISRSSIKPAEQQPSIVKIESIHLGAEKPIERVDLEEEEIVYSEQETKMSIISLEDNRFVCDIEFLNPLNTTQVLEKKNNFFNIELICVVQGYPKPVIRWNEGNKALHKNIDRDFSIIESQKSVLNDKLDANYVNDTYIVTSKLVLHKSFAASPNDLDEYKNYSCRGKFDQASPSMIENQKMVLFKIYYVDKGDNSYLARYQLKSPESKILDPETKKLDSGFLSKRSDSYWVVLLLCILVALIFILFASICIIRNVVQSYKLEKRIIEKEKAFNANRNSTYSYTHTGTVNKRPDTYSASTSTSTTRNSAIGLLKPDVIRPHQDYSSNYNMNTSSNRTPSTRQSSPNSNTNTFFYSSPISLVPHHDSAELDNLLNRNQSYDNNPIDTSLLFEDDTNLSTSSKSFDENIEQYQEPQFDDLRKPVPKRKIEHK